MISETFLADSDDDAVAHLDQGPFVGQSGKLLTALAARE